MHVLAALISCVLVSVTSGALVTLYLSLQVTTHSRLLIMSDAVQLAKLVGLKRDSIVLCSLQAFDTEQQFCKMLKYELVYSA